MSQSDSKRMTIDVLMKGIIILSGIVSTSAFGVGGWTVAQIVEANRTIAEIDKDVAVVKEQIKTINRDMRENYPPKWLVDRVKHLEEVVSSGKRR